VPTVYEALGITAPSVLDGVAQSPIEGTSMVYTFDSAQAPSHRHTQYFEMLGNRALYHDGWIASTTPLRLPWVTSGADPSPDDFQWELYNLADDPTQSHDLAASNPTKLRELQDLFWAEAARYNVLPLNASFAERVDPSIRPSLTRGRTTFTYYAGMIRIPEGGTPNVKSRSWTVEADVTIPRTGVASGVLGTQGGRFGGWGLFVLDGKPAFVYAFSNQPQHKTRFVGTQRLTAGHHVIRAEFAYEGGGVGRGGNVRLLVDGQQVAQGRIERTIGSRFSLDETFDVGEDTGTPLIDDYAARMPFRFTGTLNRLTITLGPGGSGAAGSGPPEIDP